MKLFTIKKKQSSKDLPMGSSPPLNRIDVQGISTTSSSTTSMPRSIVNNNNILDNQANFEINNSHFDDKSGEDHSSHEILATTGSEITHPERPFSKKGLSCIYTIQFLELFYSDETRQLLSSLPNYQTVKLPQKILLYWRRHVNIKGKTSYASLVKEASDDSSALYPVIKYVWSPSEEQITFKSTLFPTRSQNNTSQNSDIESIGSRSSLKSSRGSLGNFAPKILKLTLGASSHNVAEELLKFISKKHRTLASQEYDLTEAFKTGATITTVVPFDFALPLVPYDAPNSPIPNSAVTNSVVEFDTVQTESKKPSASKELGDKLKKTFSNPLKKMKNALTHKKQYQLENVPGTIEEGTSIAVRLMLKMVITSKLDSTVSVDSEPATEDNANNVTEEDEESEEYPHTGSFSQSIDNDDSSLMIPHANSEELMTQFENSSARSFEEKFNVKKAVAEKIPVSDNMAGYVPTLKVESIRDMKSGLKRSITDDSISSKSSPNPVSPRVSKQKSTTEENYQFISEQLMQEKLQLQLEIRQLKASIEDHKNRLEKQLKSVEDEKQRHIEEKRILQLVDKNLRNRILELESTVQSLEGQISAKSEQIATVAAVLEEAKEQCAALKNAVTASLKEIAAKEKTVLQLETSNSESLEKVIEAKTENQRLQAIILELEAKNFVHKNMLQNPVLISFIWGSIATFVLLLGLPFVFGLSLDMSPVEFVYYSSGRTVALFVLFTFLCFFGMELSNAISKYNNNIKLGTNVLHYFEQKKLAKLLSNENVHENIVGSVGFGLKIGVALSTVTLVLFYVFKFTSLIQYTSPQESYPSFLSKLFYSIQEGVIGELFGRFFLFQFILQVLNQVMQFAMEKSQQKEQQVAPRFSQNTRIPSQQSQQQTDDFVFRFSKWFVHFFSHTLEVFPPDRPLNSVNNTYLNQYILDPIRGLSKANSSSTSISKLTLLGILLSSTIYSFISLFFTSSFAVVQMQWFGSLQVGHQSIISLVIVYGLEFCKQFLLSSFLSYLFLIQQNVEFVIVNHCIMAFVVNWVCM